MALYVLSIAKGSWFYDVPAKTDYHFLITNFGLWSACYTVKNSFHGCECSRRILQFKLQDNVTKIPHWVGVMQLTSILGVMFILFSLIVALKSICDAKIYDSGEVKFILTGTFFMIFTHTHITYRLIIVDISHHKWGQSFILNVAGIALSLIRLILPVLYANYVNWKDQTSFTKTNYDRLGSTPFHNTSK